MSKISHLILLAVAGCLIALLAVHVTEASVLSQDTIQLNPWGTLDQPGQSSKNSTCKPCGCTKPAQIPRPIRSSRKSRKSPHHHHLHVHQANYNEDDSIFPWEMINDSEILEDVNYICRYVNCKERLENKGYAKTGALAPVHSERPFQDRDPIDFMGMILFCEKYCIEPKAGSNSHEKLSKEQDKKMVKKDKPMDDANQPKEQDKDVHEPKTEGRLGGRGGLKVRRPKRKRGPRRSRTTRFPKTLPPLLEDSRSLKDSTTKEPEDAPPTSTTEEPAEAGEAETTEKP